MRKYFKFQLHIITVKQSLLGRVQVLDSAFSVRKEVFMGRILLAILGVATVIVEEILKDD